MIIGGCNDKESRIKRDVAKMMSQQIRIPINDMQCRFNAKDTIFYDDLTADYKLVVFVDSSECSSCFIDGLYQWNDLITEIKTLNDDVRFIFVIAPKKEQIEDIYLSVDYCGLKQHIYIDTAYAFIRENKYLPKKKELQVFLLNKKNEVILVGNPYKNDKILFLLKKLISNN